MKKITLLLFLFLQAYAYSQISNFSTKFDLPNTVEETSGLLFLNNKIITHNDSGGDPALYEIDDTSGTITRTITITNATNVDWEDIAQDDTHIYVGDIGNNNGNRQDLKVYKISKTDYLNNNSVTAEIISYSYEDQIDFSSQPNNSNFDAEAISIYQNQIFIFTKNWVDNMTNAYKIPTTAGTHSAIKVSTYDVNGRITGSDYNSADDSFMLTGYNGTLTPFLIYVSSNRAPGDDIFNGGATKITLTQELGLGNQVEGITHYDDLDYYISRERVVVNIGIPITYVQRLFQFFNAGSTLSTTEYSSDIKMIISPNPSKGLVKVSSSTDFNKIAVIQIYDSRGVKLKETTSNEFDVSDFSNGVYFVHVLLENKKKIVSRIIKID